MYEIVDTKRKLLFSSINEDGTLSCRFDFYGTARWRREGCVVICEISNLDFDTIRRIVHQELAPIRYQLAIIDEKIALIPDLNFLDSSDLAQQLV
jgi:hypothetical protein